MRVKDLVSLPTIKTVIQLRDTQDPEERSRLVGNFVLTQEVSFGLRVILEHVLRGQGCGAFLKGHFGSGKSHFLAYLQLIFSEVAFLKSFIERFSEEDPSSALSLEPLQSSRPAVVAVSLVEHRSSRYLEDIVVASLRNAFPRLSQSEGRRAAPEDHPTPDPETRKTFLENVFNLLKEERYDGLIILLDELSEFLRSKPSLNDFNEDIRYLQFLGETSGHQPLWLVAAVQEYLEETGEIHQELFNKIKDRFPIRIVLTAAHVKSLASKLLIQKRPGASDPLREFFLRLRKSFPQWPVPEEEFCSLYPVHPDCVQMLEDLKPLFSKTRGIVDFIHYQIKGDPDRGISGLMGRPYQTLVCPDRIFDHFLDRIRSSIETLPYVETVYAQYVREMDSIVEEPQDRPFALRILKLLILQEISPLRRGLTVQQLTEMLLEPVSDLEPEVNYQYTRDIADLLCKRGGYVAAVEAPEPEDPFQRAYQIQLEANIDSIVDKKLDYKRQTLQVLGGHIIARLFALLVSDLSFFRGLRLGYCETMVVDWQNTRRNGALSVPAGDGAPAEEIEAGSTPSDFSLLALLPGQGDEALTAVPKGLGPNLGILQPAPVTELDRCLQMLALVELRQEYQEDNSTQGRRILDRLNTLIEDELALAQEIYQRSLETSRLLGRQGEELHRFEGLRCSNYQEIMQQAAVHLLESRFPKHYLIAPLQDYYPKGALAEVAGYFRAMSQESFDRLGWGRTVLDGFLVPTGVLTRRRGDYLFARSADECEPLKLLLGLVAREEPCSALHAQQFLADSEFGMSERQFTAFLLAALFGGFVVGFGRGRKISLNQLDPNELLKLEKLATGETISAATASRLSRLSATPKNLRKSSLSFSECQQLWEILRSFHEETARQLAELRHLLNRYREYRVYELLDRQPLGKILETIEGFLEVFRRSHPPIQGLETLAQGVESIEEFNSAARMLAHSHSFFTDSFSGFVFIGNYLGEATRSIPPGAAYEVLSERVEALSNRLKDWDPSGDPARFQGLESDFETWHHAYIRDYQKEHESFQHLLDQPRLQGSLENEQLGLLARLEKLAAFVPEKSSTALKQELSSIQGRRCKRSIWEELQQRPLCGCGFRLGQRLQENVIGRVQGETEDQLKQFVIQVQHPRFRELLDRFEFYLLKKGDSTTNLETRSLASSQRLKSVTTLDELLAMKEHLTADFILHLDSFEPSRKPFEVKYLSDFRQRVGSQPKTRQSLVSEFDGWLEAGLSDPSQPIRLMNEPQKQMPGARALLESLLPTSSPEVAQDLDRLTSEEFVFRLLASELAVRYRIDPDLAQQQLTLLPRSGALSSYAELGAALVARDEDWLLDFRQQFEEQLAESTLVELGLLTDSAADLAQLIAQESAFLRPVHHATKRLVRKLLHADSKSLKEVEKVLEEGWTPFRSQRASQEKEPYRVLLNSLLWVRQAEQQLGQAREDDTRRQPSLAGYEKLFTQTAAEIPFMLDRLRAHLTQLEWLDALDLVSVENRSRELLNQFCQDYSQRIQQSEDRLPRAAGIVKDQTSQLSSSLDSESVRFVFVDALAWSLWQPLCRQLERRMPPHVRLLEEKVAYAHLPSNTMEQVKQWLAAGGLQPQQKIQKGFSFQGRGEDNLTYKLDWIDDKIHSSRESPYFLHTEIIEQLLPQMLAFLGKLPRRTLLILFSDHGFVENPAFLERDKHRFPRYHHGGGSPFELVIPVAFFYSGPGR